MKDDHHLHPLSLHLVDDRWWCGWLGHWLLERDGSFMIFCFFGFHKWSQYRLIGVMYEKWREDVPGLGAYFIKGEGLLRECKRCPAQQVKGFKIVS